MTNITNTYDIFCFREPEPYNADDVGAASHIYIFISLLNNFNSYTCLVFPSL